MSDVAQILGLAPSSGASSRSDHTISKELQNLKPTGGTTPTKVHKKHKKLTGMQREVVELLESHHRVNHALYPGMNKLSLHQKWKERKDIPAVKWIRKSFYNPARVSLPGEDNPTTALALSHWVKAHSTPSDYVFARFNVQCEIFQYTDQEYEAVLSNHIDPLYPTKWTRAETDLLIELCKRFDLRWIIITDQFSMHPIMLDTPVPRTVEDLKYRYYEVIRLISQYRKESLEPYRYNVTYEKQRKRQLELAFVRTMEEEVELKQVQEELKNVEQQLKKTVVKLDFKKKKEIAQIQLEEKVPGVSLRSTTLTLPTHRQALNGKMIKKMQVMLEEMGVPLRPMPTKWTCEAYDALRQEMIGLFTLQKHLTTKRNEMETLKERYQTLTGTVYERITSDLPRQSVHCKEIIPTSTPAVTETTVPPISKGKAEKGNKRRGSTIPSGISAKRNKKVL